MQISEAIKILQDIKDKQGDMPLYLLCSSNQVLRDVKLKYEKVGVRSWSPYKTGFKRVICKEDKS